MLVEIFSADCKTLIESFEATPLCGVDFCDDCGDCLHCYPHGRVEWCHSGRAGSRWVLYEDEDAKRIAELRAGLAAR